MRLPHLFVSTRRRSSVVDEALARLGRSRRITVSVPHFLVAPYIIVESDVIMTVNSRIARTLSIRMLPRSAAGIGEAGGPGPRSKAGPRARQEYAKKTPGHGLSRL